MSLKRMLLLALAALTLPVAAQAKRIAIVKADDIFGPHPKWDRFFRLAAEHDVPVSAGIIANSFARGEEYVAWLKKWEATGKVEFWNHGWDHRRWEEDGRTKSEFGGSGYEHQRKHLAMVQEAGKTALGKPFIAFGSPFNDMDADTARALNEIPELRLVFCRPDAEPTRALTGKILMPMPLRGEEDGTGKPDFAKFKEQYAKKQASLTFCAFQFHPQAFSEAGFGEFAAIVDFLKAEGWTFMLPADYAKSVAGDAPAP